MRQKGTAFIPEITDTDIKRHDDTIIPLAAAYRISAYAMKSGYENSDVAAATLYWVKANVCIETKINTAKMRGMGP